LLRTRFAGSRLGGSRRRRHAVGIVFPRKRILHLRDGRFRSVALVRATVRISLAIDFAGFLRSRVCHRVNNTRRTPSVFKPRKPVFDYYQLRRSRGVLLSSFRRHDRVRIRAKRLSEQRGRLCCIFAARAT